MGVLIEHANVIPLMSTDDRPVVLDTNASVVHLFPRSPGSTLSPVFNDISIHHISNAAAEEQLETFRRAFIPIFPFVYIPTTISASELRQLKPFLWLVIMSLTTKSVAQQFELEETIWQIISRRIVIQHLADLDLLLGIICFASWSVPLIVLHG
jgi:hypothetical protein